MTSSFTTLDIVTLAVTILAMAVLSLFVRRTPCGHRHPRASENLRAAHLMGININQVIAVAFAIGSALAALAGFLWAAKYGTVDPFMGFLPGLKAFVAAVIGGIGIIPGAVLGGFLLGFAEIFFVAFLPPALVGLS